MKANVSRRLASGCILTLAVLAAAPVATTSAAPILTIESPVSGSYTQEPRPTIRGSTSEPASPVKVKLESGGQLVADPITVSQPESGRWEATLSASLAPGIYTAIAAQGESLAASTFTLVGPPVVTIEPVPSPSPDETPALSGRAGDQPWDAAQVTLKIYAGAVPSGILVDGPLHVPTSGGAWSAGPVPLLPEGEYTAIAAQDYHGERPALSEPVTFVVERQQHPPASTPPAASLTWIPVHPLVGETVSLVSTSLGGSSPIVSYAWDPEGTGPFVGAGAVFTTKFARPGPHQVRLLVTDSSGASALAQATIAVGAQHGTLMQPFPIVRIAGAVTASGARLRLLSVQAPPGARVTIRCRGRHCATNAIVRVVRATATSARTGMSLVTFPRFEVSLRAGTVLQIVVTRGTDIGKYTSFAIRSGQLPVRNDACIDPSGKRPRPCPTS